MKIRQLSQMSENDLQSKLGEAKKEMMKLNMARSTSAPLENPGRLRQVRKTIAKINFLIHTKNFKNKARQNLKQDSKKEEKQKSNE